MEYNFKQNPWVSLPESHLSFNVNHVSHIIHGTLADEKKGELPTHDYTVLHFVSGKEVTIMGEDLDLLNGILDRLYGYQKEDELLVA